MGYKWKPNKSQRRAFAIAMQDSDFAASYYEAKAEKAAKRRATSKFNYESAGGYYVPTKEQHDAAFKCFDELKLTPQQEEACNRVISGYSLNEKIYHDNIHIVNELKHEHNF